LPKASYPEVTGGALLAAAGIISLLVLVPPLRLRDRIREAKPLKGKSRDEVIEALGESREIEREGGGVTRETWRAGWASITLEFTRGVCTAVRREAH
jgi:hypothetical protein